jgi:hypothetical protein
MSMPLKSLCAAAGVAGLLLAASAGATPVTYTAFVVTDVSLGGHLFRNASVHMTFVGDTADVQPFSVKAPDGVVGSGWQIATGNASVRIVSGRRHIKAKFLPNQILVSFDYENGGAGFSAFVGSDHHLEPAYPLTFDGSSVDFFMPDLVTTGNWTGHAWSCIGFPPVVGNTSTRCGDPKAFPLQTDRGELVIFQPYETTNSDGTIYDNYEGSDNVGIFSTLVGP